MARIRIQGSPTHMGASLLDIPAFPGESFGMGFPEAIGDHVRTTWFNRIQTGWKELGDGVWESSAGVDGELTYTVTATPYEDYVDVHIRLTNESDRAWEHTLAFNCFQCGGANSIRDHECVRHWVGLNGRPRRLIELPRVCGPRPTVQLYSVEGAPLGRDIPFVAGFRATPDIVLEGWMAIQSWDGRRLAATVSRPAMFLFQNMEYSCIHSASGFGPLRPGESGEALTRLYFVEAGVEEWHERMRSEMD